MADQSVRGRFVWHELVTPDSTAAHAFYAKAIGWKSLPWEEDASYVMFAAPRGPIGATVAGDGSSHWLPYIGTGDIDRTVELAKQKGGAVLKGVDTLSSGSRHAILQDPYGAMFGVYESADQYGKITPAKTGEHSWHELMSTDHEAAFDFYAALFGWQKLRAHDMGPLGTYLIYGLNGTEYGGMMRVMDGGPAPAWVSYVHVKDVNQTAKKVKSAGGQVINGPLEVPGGDWIVQAVDPQGALFAAHASAADMNRSEKAAQAAKSSSAKSLAAKSKLDASETPKIEEPQLPLIEEAPPVEAPPAAPAEKAPAKKAPAKKSPPQEAPAKEAPPAEAPPSEEAPAKQAPAKKSPAKQAPAKKKAPAKKAPAKKPSKAPARKSGKKSGKKSSRKSSRKSLGKTAGSNRTSAKRGAAKRGAKVTAKVKTKSKTRSGGNKKAARKPRKGK